MHIQIKKTFICILLCLPLVLVGYKTPVAQANQTPRQSSIRPSLPAPLKILSAQRLKSQPDRRYPPADFGRSFVLGDGILAVGAPSITGGDEMSAPGSVYVYRRGASGWAEETQLVAGNQNDSLQKANHFGMSLALQDQSLLVGAPDADSQSGKDSGAVYVFEAGSDGWKETTILRAPQPAAEAQFGMALAIDGNNLCVLEGTPTQGSRLWLFEGHGDQWSQTALIEPLVPDGWTGGISGFDLYGDLLALSVMYRQGEEAQTQFSGKLLWYRFDGVTWTAVGEMPNLIAYQLALDGQGSTASRLAVASIWDSVSAMGPGMVTVYNRQGNDWIVEDTISSPDSGSAQYWDSGFGAAVALQGDLLVAGAPMYSEDAFWDGVAYLYQLYEGRWVDQLRLTPTEDGGQGDFFGSAAIYGNTVLVSAPDEFGNAVYIYELGAGLE